MAKRFSAKRVHVACLLMAAVALFLVPQIGNKYLLFLPMVGFGIAWASMMGVPYIMVVSSVPKERYGVYMGIVNMMIVIPMILQTLSFGWIYEHLLGQRPGNALVFAGVLLLLAALAMLRIREPKVAEDLELAPAGGH
jgi:maltose/moltooligosaccharide transporter